MINEGKYLVSIHSCILPVKFITSIEQITSQKVTPFNNNILLIHLFGFRCCNIIIHFIIHTINREEYKE